MYDYITLYDYSTYFLDIDRHNNYLVLKSNKLYADALPCAIPPLSIFSEIQEHVVASQNKKPLHLDRNGIGKLQKRYIFSGWAIKRGVGG